MGSAFHDVIGQALATVAGVAGELVTYHRGAQSCELVGVQGSSGRRTDEGGLEIPTTADAVDWILERAELELAGVAITPRRGDQVRRTVAGVVQIYEVGSDGEQVWRWSDRGRTRYRVHTKEAPPA